LVSYLAISKKELIMKMRTILHYTAAITILLLPITSLGAEVGKRPNILWIIAEDMSQDLGCYGNKIVTTPNIDQLAAKGMKFNNVFTTGPACSPSRTSLATGVYQTTLGAYHMRYSQALKPRLPKPIKILPEMMRENGYYTGNIRNINGVGSAKNDWLFQTRQKSWDTHTWADLTKNKPFFGQINLRSAHRGFARSKKNPVSADKITLPPYYPDHSVSKQDWARYLEAVNVVDEQVGTILKLLKRDNLAENTIVCFLSDHGRPMTRGKNWLYDSGTQIPLIIFYPESITKPDGYQTAGENIELISSVDLVAETVLMAGGKIPDWMQGRSILQKDSMPREYIYTAVDRVGNIETCSRAVRTNKFKYIRNFKTPGSITACATFHRQSSHPMFHLLNIMGEKDLLTPAQSQLLKSLAKEELYDLENDPFETVNLADNKKFSVVRKELEQRLSEWIKQSKDRGFEPDSDAVVKYFREYGVTEMKSKKTKIDKLRLSIEKHFK